MSSNYKPTKWLGGKTIGTAQVMNNIEKGISDAHDRLDDVDSQIKDIENEKLDKDGIVTMSNMGQDVKNAMINGSVAVVGGNSVDMGQFSIKIQNDIGTYEQQTITRFEHDVVVNESNDISIGSSQWWSHTKIPISEGQKLKITTYKSNPSVPCIIFSDYNNKCIHKELFGTGNNEKVTDYEVIAPNGSSYIYVNTSTTNTNSENLKISVLTYNPIATKKEIENISKKIPNIDDVYKYIEIGVPYKNGCRYIISNDRVIEDTSDSKQYYTALIKDVVENEKYAVSFKWTYNTYYGVIFVDDNYKVISKYLLGTGTLVNYVDYKLVVPSGATKLIVQNEDSLNPAIIKKYDIVFEKKSQVVPYFYKTHLDNKINEIKEFEYEYGCDGESFIFITDLHLDDNRCTSASLVSEICKNTNANKVIFGGDLLKSYLSSENDVKNFSYDYIKKYGNNSKANLYTICGNHDLLGFNKETHVAEYVQSQSKRYGLLGKPMEDYVCFGDDKKGMYYYFDNKHQKIRYICLNAYENSLGGECNVSDTQINWLKTTALNGLDSNWSIIIFTHCGLTPITNPNGYNNENVVKIKNTIDDIGTTHNIIACISGHMHKDLNEISNGILHISIPCDAPYPDDGLQRPSNTVHESCFDVICINKVSRKINCIRVGAGNNRVFTY